MRFSVVGDVTGIRPVLTTAVSFAIAVKFIGFICVASGFEVGSDLTVIADHSSSFSSASGVFSGVVVGSVGDVQISDVVMFPFGVGILFPFIHWMAASHPNLYATSNP